MTHLVGLIGVLFSSWAYSLGLGEITLNSNLNEPLDAEIRLLQVRDLRPEEILVELASEEDFERAGVERVFFLLSLDFDVDLNSPRGPVVHITSDRPVREPYVNFLVSVQWPSGRLLREYTLLLDLPAFADQPARPVQPAQQVPEPQPAPQQPAQQPAPAQQPEPAPQQPAPEPATVQPAPQPAPVQPSPAEPEPVVEAQPRPAPAPEPEPEPVIEQPSVSTAAPSSADADVGNYGPVQTNETLWEIALRVRPDRSLSVHQTMLALQRLNPDAFINNNINLLKEGQVLRIPDAGEISSMGLSDAVDEVAQQNIDRFGNPDGQVAGAPIEATRPTVDTPDAPREVEGQLTLTAPGDSQATGQTAAGDTGSAALETELASNMELLDSVRSENEELNNRVGDLDEQIETIERLLEVSNEELSNLQQAMGQEAGQQDDAEPAVVEEGAVEEDAAEADVAEDAAEAEAAEDVAAAEAEEATETPADESAEATAEPESQPAPASPVQSTTESIVDLLMDNLWYLLTALVVIVAGIAWFMHRRAHAEMAAFEAAYDDEEFYQEDDDLALDAGAPLDTADEEGDFDLGETDGASDQADTPTAPTEAQTGDAVGEADIYIAYGKFDQAEDLLQRALISEPDNPELRLKLLEVHAEAQDIDKFDSEYGQLLGMADDATRQRAEDLRASIPGAGTFAAAAGGAAAAGALSDSFAGGADEGSSGDMDLSLDSFGFDEEPGQSDTAGEAEADTADLGDLTLDFDSGTEQPGDESAAAGDEDAAIDFDLDLDGEDPFARSETDTTDTGGDSLSLTESAGAGEGDVGESEETDLDFSLDLDGDDLSGDSDDTALELDTGASTDTELNLDLGDSGGSDEAGDDFNLDGLEDDDFLSDLEFSAASSPSAGQDEPAPEPAAPAPSGSDKTAGADDLDSEFDLEMGDVNLAELDQEMDELVGKIDDDDDVPQASASGNADTDLDDMISLDDPALDSLSAGKDSPEPEPPTYKAAADTSSDSGVDELDSELDFLQDTDEVATKLDLARAYIDMGDKEGAKDILDEVMAEGNAEQKTEAQMLMGKL